MAVSGSSTNQNGDILLISLQEPYKNVVEVLSYQDKVIGESTSCFYDKSFRWGIDGVSYSDWIPLSNSHLRALLLDPNNPFWIEYKYEQVGVCTLTFESIALETVNKSGTICKIPQIECCDGQLLSGSQNLVIDCCSEPWNPYDLSRAAQMYKQLSAIASNIFGFCVKYFKTAADQRSKDVILKEYSLYNVIATNEVKILVPDNELPTRAINFNPLMMDFPVQFEIHIVKSEFEKVFGIGSRPEVRDYLYFEKYLNMVYEIDAVAESDDFLYSGSYWRVSLVVYQQRTELIYSDKNIEEEKNSIVTNIEDRFYEDRNNEQDDVRKPNQYNTIGTLANDYVRRILDKKLIISEENVYNNWTIISKYHYDLSSMNKGSETVEYRYTGGLDITESRSFTFWFRPKYDNPIGNNVSINSISNNNGYVQLNTSGLFTDPRQKINVGDWVIISGTQSYNSIHKVISVTDVSLVIDTPYIDNVLLVTPKFYREVSNEFISYQKNTSTLFSLIYSSTWFVIEINSTYYKFRLLSQALTLVRDKWYAVVINLNNLARQLSLFIYETIEDANSYNPELTSTLNKVYSETKTISQISLEQNNSWKLLACKSDLTNIRIWKTPIEEEQHDIILSQYVVNDTHLTLLVDNATPELMLNRVTNPR